MIAWSNDDGYTSVEVFRGDMMIFSANMLHRGLYGMNRLSLDLLFGDPSTEIAKFIRWDTLPNRNDLGSFESATAFAAALRLCPEQ